MRSRTTRQFDAQVEQELLDLLNRDEHVQLAYLFGSAAKRGLRFDSDLDVGIASSGGPLQPALLRATAQKITAFSGRAADVVDLRVAPLALLRAALVEGRQLLSSDPALLHVLRLRLVHETEDFLPYQRRLLEERRRRWTGT